MDNGIVELSSPRVVYAFGVPVAEKQADPALPENELYGMVRIIAQEFMNDRNNRLDRDINIILTEFDEVYEVFSEDKSNGQSQILGWEVVYRDFM